ncbi:unnamed protein product, partial [Symbiodinium sp. KB8]
MDMWQLGLQNCPVFNAKCRLFRLDPYLSSAPVRLRVFPALTGILVQVSLRFNLEPETMNLVEEVLRSLLSNPEAVKPLPTAYFVAVLSAICSFPIPKELPLRLVSSFLDREQMGQHTVQPEQWAEILCAIRPLDEWPSYERITPRLIQHLLPHLQGLPANALLTVLKSLSAKPFSHVLQFEAPTAFGPLKRAPRSFSRAAAKAVQDGKWDLRQVVEAFSALSKLGFYE